MAKKKPAKPLAELRYDFIDSLENVCQQAIMLIQAVETVLQHAEKVPGRNILQERVDALRKALIGE